MTKRAAAGDSPPAETMRLQRQYRKAADVQITPMQDSASSGEYELSFSDETPVDRFFGKEILLHGPGNVRLSRINNGAPLLMNHVSGDPRGIVVPGSVRVGSDRRARGRVRFFTTQAGRDAKTMIDEGMRNVSVGYDIYSVRELASGDGFEATDWEPVEVSIAPVPAVAGVGFSRSAPGTEHEVCVTRHSATAVRDAESRLPAASAAHQGVAMSDAMTAAAAGNADTGTPSVQMGHDGASQERLRISTIDALCRRNYGQYKPSDDDRAKWISEGKTADEVSQTILEQIATRAKATTKESPGHLGLSESEIKRYSISRAINACINKNWQASASYEAEISQAISRRLGRAGASEWNFFVPLEVQQASAMGRGQRDMNVATNTLGGYLVGTQVTGFIDLLRNRSVVMRLGATMLPGLSSTVSIPKLTAASTAYWFANETGTATESTPTIGQLGLTPKTVGGYVEVSRQLMLQTNYNADAIINGDLARVIGLAVDSAALAGPGTAGQPTGIVNVSGLGAANPTAGTACVYADVIRFQTVVAGGNAMMPGFAYVTTPTVAGIFMAKPRFTNSDTPIWQGNILDGQVVGAPAMTSLQVGSGSMLAGDFSNVVIGEWGVLEIEANPYAQFQSGIVGIRALYTVDVGVRYAAAFALGTGMTG